MKEQDLIQKIQGMEPEVAALHLQKRMVGRGRMGVLSAGQVPEERLELEENDLVGQALAEAANVPYSVKP